TLAPMEAAGLRPAGHAKSATAPPAVVQAYLRGRDQYQQWTHEGSLRALQYYDQALAIDSTFAAAFAGRADVLTFLSFAPHTLALARASIAKALALAPDLGEAHASRAKFLFESDWNWAEAEREFRRAIELNPNDSNAHHHYSHLLAALGRVPEAREQARIMLTLDPLAPASHHHMAWLDLECGQFEAADSEFAKVAQLDAGYVATYILR